MNSFRLKYSLFLFFLLLNTIANANNIIVNYDIIYVRYPATSPTSKFVAIPQGEKPYDIAAGADLILLKPDGTEEILVDCNKCSIMDPFISYDANWVYYSFIEEPTKASASWIYKINLRKKPYTPIRLTFDTSFNNNFYNKNTSTNSDLKNHRMIRDMAPVPLADGRILFTSNRSSFIALNPGANSTVTGSVQQLYVLDDHDGNATTEALSNLHRMEAGNLHMVQHPFQLKDGRIIFSSWQDAGHKFLYAMTNLFTINPDGSNLKQFTEPHDHNKMLEHFVTQLSTEDVVTALYYPSFDYGFGILMRYPILENKHEFLRGSIQQPFIFGLKSNISRREFDRNEGLSITPHTTPNDVPSPGLSGKYSMPSYAPNNQLLVAYSTGSVNHFHAACSKNKLCEPLKSGIYIIPNASKNIIKDPSQLIKIKDDPNYNEIWPRAVVRYEEIYGIKQPKLFPSTENINSKPYGLVGTSSMYNRESNGSDDPFQSNGQRELHDGNWTIQGAEAGVFSNTDVYGVRIIATPAKPFTKTINKYTNNERWESIKPYLLDKRLENVVARYGSFHGEKWEILGEFPLMHKLNGLIDPQGNPDTSWQAKVPADTPFLIQMLDKKGMTLVSELTWRALKPGEIRTDCGGCHAHSISALDFDTTATGKGYLLYDVAGVDDFDPRIDNGTWDLTKGSIPLLAENKVEFHKSGVLDVEFRRDVFPILESKCLECHKTSNVNSTFVLTKNNADKTYQDITYNKRKNGKKFVTPQISRFIRSPQARQSLLVWIAWNERLDGRKNSTRDNDIDFPSDHPIMDLSDKEKRTIARWVDMGGPIDFPQTDGFGYTDDSQLPIIHLSSPILGTNERDIDVLFGLHDTKSGIDEASINVSFEYVNMNNKAKLIVEKISVPPFQLRLNKSPLEQGVYSLKLPQRYMKISGDYIITIQVSDKTGNKNILTRRFTLI
jgi:hypothetical protein